MTKNDTPKDGFLRSSFWVGLAVILAIGLFFLYAEHKAHLYGALPWILLAACPLLHLFMHRGHGGHGGHDGHGGHGERQGGDRR